VEAGSALESYLPAGMRTLARFGAPMPCLLAPSPAHMAPPRRHGTRARHGDRAAGEPPEEEGTPAEVAMLLFVPCRTAMGGKFPLNGTYFQSNEVFLVSSTLADPVMVRASVSCCGAASRAHCIVTGKDFNPAPCSPHATPGEAGRFRCIVVAVCPKDQAKMRRLQVLS